MAIASNEPVWTVTSEIAPSDPLAAMECALHELDVPAVVAEGLVALVACHQGHRLPRLGFTSTSEDTRRQDEHTVSSTARVASEEALDSDTLLEAARGARVVQNFADAMLVTAARTLADRAGREFLSRKGIARPTELAPTARERWRAKTKSVVAHELATLTGYGVNACHARVGFALAPRATVAPAERAMLEGVTDWRAVSQYWQRCRSMEVKDATQVGDAVFAPLMGSATPEDVDPRESKERGSGVRLETWQEFHRRLDREATRVEGQDAAAEKARRARARQLRDTRAEISDDGLGTLFATAGTASVVASIERIETIARRARKAGDERSLAHIRSDTTMALLVHGILPFGDPACDQGDPTAQEPGASTPEPGSRSQESSGEAHQSSGEAHQSSGEAHQSSDGSALLQPPENVCRIIAGLPNASVEVVVPISAFFSDHAKGADSAAKADATNAAVAARPGTVAEIPGHGWLSAAHARELAITPGAVLHRLLTDPVDGRLMERSTKAYRPDAAMRAHVQALDRTCRAPGCTIPAHRCELDHEIPFDTDGGLTSAGNLNPKHARHHQLKTERFWASTMDETRAVTWTTLFGRVYTTFAHDYREYCGTPGTSADGADGADGAAVRGTATLGPAQTVVADDADLRDQLIYAALSTREGRDNWLEAMDDDPEHPEGQWSGVPLSLFRREGGSRRHGSPPRQASVGQLLGVEPVPTVPNARPPRVTDPGPPPF